jgi:DNA recombination protein RmuC
MLSLLLIFGGTIVAVFGFASALFFRKKFQEVQKENQELLKRNIELEATQRCQADAQETFSHYIKSLCADALSQNTAQLLTQAQTLFTHHQEFTKGQISKQEAEIKQVVQPLSENLGKVQKHMQELERERLKAYEGLNQRVTHLDETQKILREYTGTLVKALHVPNIRGKWGEVQLKRLIELAGMLPYCDFLEQYTTQNESQILRPDLIIRLPGNKNIILDAKVPLHKYMESTEALHEKERKKILKEHATHIRQHIKALKDKQYTHKIDGSYEFVILFLPMEALLITALEADIDLLEYSAAQNVLIATPMTLLALLRTIVVSWRHEKIQKNTEAIAMLSEKIINSLQGFLKDFTQMGTTLNKARLQHQALQKCIEGSLLPEAQELSCQTLIEEQRLRPRKVLSK